jgi:hypothetical protein
MIAIASHAEMRDVETTSAQGGVTTLGVTQDPEAQRPAGVTAVVLTPDFTPTQPGTYTLPLARRGSAARFVAFQRKGYSNT